MIERDPRWARVEGGMTRWSWRPDEEPTGSRIDIAVIGPTGHRVTQTIILTDDARKFAVVDPLPAVLDQMVRKLDEALHA